MNLRSRTELLAEVINLDDGFDRAVSELSKHEFDSDEELVQLNELHIINVMNRYISGALDDSRVERWANVIEGRDDIGISDRKGDQIISAVHKLANPVLEGELDLALAREIIAELA